MTPIPFTLDMYKAQLQKMMTTPMAQGIPNIPQPAGTSIVDKLRAAATALSGTVLAGSTLG